MCTKQENPWEFPRIFVVIKKFVFCAFWTLPADYFLPVLRVVLRKEEKDEGE